MTVVLIEARTVFHVRLKWAAISSRDSNHGRERIISDCRVCLSPVHPPTAIAPGQLLVLGLVLRVQNALEFGNERDELAEMWSQLFFHVVDNLGRESFLKDRFFIVKGRRRMFLEFKG